MNQENKKELEALIVEYDQAMKEVAEAIERNEDCEEQSDKAVDCAHRIVALTKKLLAEPLTPDERYSAWNEQNMAFAVSEVRNRIDYYIDGTYFDDKKKEALKNLSDKQVEEIARNYMTNWDMGEGPFDDDETWNWAFEMFIDENIND